ncbi:MAG: hypothetical protein KAJ07_06685 [Planctomycetes bacterium]|nr:hypothetical protein [Planctomycetota bacterium]
MRKEACFIISTFFLLGIMKAEASQKIGIRQIHLDFHTSEHLPDIGRNFSKRQFQQALKTAHVDAVNVFAKGHHSWSYYPTKVGKMHPNLDFDLLGAQIEACHEIGVLAPVYYTIGWSANDADSHPEWCARNRDGSVITTSPFDFSASPDKPRPPFHWIFLCVNTGYHGHIIRQVEEISRKYDIDGFWFDIYQSHQLCYCEVCRKDMTDQGIDIDDHGAVEAYHIQIIKKHQKDLRELIAKYHPEATVFFNGTTSIDHDSNFRFRMYEYNTMQDMEDLPTTWGGYDKLPIQSKFFLKAGYPVTAMSGKFHTSWGEFGGFKHPNAIKYEAASMIAWGARCNFGDQLHPSGEMDMATYKNIGQAYAYIEKIEDYGIGGIPVARVGLWRSYDKEHDEGLAKILLESHVNFDIANPVKDLSSFDVIVIPGKACLNIRDAERLNAFAKRSGNIIVMGEGALNLERNKVLLDIGATYQGKAIYDMDYLVVADTLNSGLVASPFLNYKPAIRVNPKPGVKVLASIRYPYFSRTYGKFTSHQNTPYQLEDAQHPGIIRNGNIIFIAHELDKMYYDHGARLHRDLFFNVLKLVHIRPMVATELPSAGRLSMLHQPKDSRYVVHLLYGPPIKRGRCEVIEDLPLLYNVPVSIDVPQEIKKALLVPDMRELIISRKNGKLSVTVPKFQCHCAVVLEY